MNRTVKRTAFIKNRYIFCNITNVFTTTFDDFNAPVLKLFMATSVLFFLKKLTCCLLFVFFFFLLFSPSAPNVLFTS